MRIRSLLAPIAVLALVAAGCSIIAGEAPAIDGSSTTSPTPTATTEPSTLPTATTEGSTTTTSVVEGIEVTITDCSEAADGFEALCRSVDLITTEFVNGVDVDVLVAGAIEGIESIDSDEPTVAVPDAILCAVPDAGYGPVCDAIAADVAAGDGEVADIVVEAIQGMIIFGIDDPFSAYLSPDALDLFSTNQSGAVEGIGALVQARETGEDGVDVLCQLLSESCRIYIVTPLDGSPAEASGVLPGDAIVRVDGNPVVGKAFDEVTAQVRGPAGTDVVLTLDRDGETFDVTVTRASIDIPITDSRMLDDDTGYLRLTTFTNNSAEVVREDLRGLLDQGATSIVFDMQGNPGGSLNAAVLIASEFLSDGLVLRTEARVDGDEYPVAPGGLGVDTDLRVVVLVDGGSASASEVVTGALQEAERAVVIGEATFGKNTVQRIWGLPNGGGLKLTIARWVTPNGVDYGLDGIAPDVAIEIPDDATNQFLIDAALAYLDTADASS